MKIAVVGAGSWGTALADHLARRGHAVRLWAFEPEVVQCIRDRRENALFLPGCFLHDGILPTTDMPEALDSAGAILFVVPSHVARSVLASMASHVPSRIPLVSATKGIETESLMLPTEVIRDVLGSEWAPWIGSLSGPSFAREVAKGLPTAVSLAMGDQKLAPSLQEAFSSPTLRVYTNPDLIGLQIGGAVKNVIAVAAGLSDGLGFGNSARAALITRGLAEMRRLGTLMGARPETFAGLSGLGDLVLTCTGDLSRNRTLGVKLGQGMSAAEILAGSRMVAEGYHTSAAVVRLADKFGADMPICRQTHAIMHAGKGPAVVFQELMSRDLKDEAADRPLA